MERPERAWEHRYRTRPTGLGWSIILLATLVIHHFDLFGLRQVWLHAQARPQSELKFSTPLLYRVVRRPLYVGWITVFRSTPVMTITHLFFAVITTVYILVAIQLEERDLMAKHPEYSEYRRQMPMIVPALPKPVVILNSARTGDRKVYEAAADFNRA